MSYHEDYTEPSSDYEDHRDPSPSQIDDHPLHGQTSHGNETDKTDMRLSSDVVIPMGEVTSKHAHCQSTHAHSAQPQQSDADQPASHRNTSTTLSDSLTPVDQSPDNDDGVNDVEQRMPQSHPISVSVIVKNGDSNDATCPDDIEMQTMSPNQNEDIGDPQYDAGHAIDPISYSTRSFYPQCYVIDDTHETSLTPLDNVTQPTHDGVATHDDMNDAASSDDADTVSISSLADDNLPSCGYGYTEPFAKRKKTLRHKQMEEERADNIAGPGLMMVTILADTFASRKEKRRKEKEGDVVDGHVFSGDRLQTQKQKYGLDSLTRATGLKIYGFKEKVKEKLEYIHIWGTAFKDIEGKFGPAILSYFRFIRWMFFLNIFISLVMFFVLTFPLILFPPKQYSEYLIGLLKKLYQTRVYATKSRTLEDVMDRYMEDRLRVYQLRDKKRLHACIENPVDIE